MSSFSMPSPEQISPPLETPSAGKYRELAQQPAFGLREQVVAPVDRGLERCRATDVGSRP
jgi:hypothetical protein